jgi:hypothetical protein
MRMVSATICDGEILTGDARLSRLAAAFWP